MTEPMRRKQQLMTATGESASQQALRRLRNELSYLSPPIIVYNKSHSGSRLLAHLLDEAGIFMGAHKNESNDSRDVLKLVEYLVEKYYPDYSPLWRVEGAIDDRLLSLARDVFAAHTEGLPSGRPWGWKLCETAYILPVLDFLFPQAKYIHLLRDGRDVAFTDHRPPNRPFWKKIYFNTDQILAWRGLRFNSRDYARRSHIYNALHWANSVAIGRGYGSMLRERYLEVRYEDLCQSFDTTAGHVLAFCGTSSILEVINKLRPTVYQNSVGKYLAQPTAKVAEVIETVKPLLISTGYLKADGLLDVARARLTRPAVP